MYRQIRSSDEKIRGDMFDMSSSVIRPHIERQIGSQPPFPTPELVLWEAGLVLATVLGFAVLVDLVLSATGQIPG
jgi:hypothetical protein